jgi:predicted nucleotidyltransferase
MTAPSTPYPEVNAVLSKLLRDAEAILGSQFTGLYLHGSLAYGDFNPETSDIDFLVVTEDVLPPRTFSALKDMHARLFHSGLAWSQKLEGAYLPKEALRRHNPHQSPIPWLGEDGHFALEGLGSDWVIQRWILREKGRVVAGPPLAGLIDPVSPEDLRQAVRGSLQEWWSPPFPSPKRFQSGAYQAYAILTMCRSLYVIENGRVASKPEAARWALQTLGEPWRGLISAAAAWRPGTEFDKLDETLEFNRFTLGTCLPVL